MRSFYLPYIVNSFHVLFHVARTGRLLMDIWMGNCLLIDALNTSELRGQMSCNNMKMRSMHLICIGNGITVNTLYFYFKNNVKSGFKTWVNKHLIGNNYKAKTSMTSIYSSMYFIVHLPGNYSVIKQFNKLIFIFCWHVSNSKNKKLKCVAFKIPIFVRVFFFFMTK